MMVLYFVLLLLLGPEKMFAQTDSLSFRNTFPANQAIEVDPDQVNELGITLGFNQSLNISSIDDISVVINDNQHMDWSASAVDDSTLILAPISSSTWRFESGESFILRFDGIHSIEGNEVIYPNLIFTTAENAIIRTINESKRISVRVFPFIDSTGTVFFIDRRSIVKLLPDGTDVVIAGNGGNGFSGDGGPAIDAQLSNPRSPFVDAAGNLFFADSHRIRKVSSAGVISTVAGTGEEGYSGDGGPAIQAKLYYPAGLSMDVSGNLYFADCGNRQIRKITPDGIIQSVTSITPHGDIDHGLRESMCSWFFHVDPQGNIILVESKGVERDVNAHEDVNAVISKISPNGVVTKIMGNGKVGYHGDGGPATEASADEISGIAVDASGAIFFSDHYNRRIRKIYTNGIVATIAGTGTLGHSGDGDLAVKAQIFPRRGRDIVSGLHIDTEGNLIFVEENRVRMIAGVAAPTPLATVATSGNMPTSVLPNTNELYQNFPNPFNSSTTIAYELVYPENVHLQVFDISGQTVRTLVRSTQQAGFYKVAWDGRNDRGHLVSTGVYLVRLNVGKWTKAHKALLIR